MYYHRIQGPFKNRLHDKGFIYIRTQNADKKQDIFSNIWELY